MFDNYKIPMEYKSRVPSHWDDREETDKWQNFVYEQALTMSKEHNLSSILDVGCGSGFKLIKFFDNDNYTTTGIEVEPCLSFLKEKYPNKVWLQGDWKQPVKDHDLLICSDVIEHIVDPDEVLEFVRGCDSSVVVMSTPVRDNMGPPTNECHAREWSLEEFQEYLNDRLPEYQWELTSQKIRSSLIELRRRSAILATGIKK